MIIVLGVMSGGLGSIEDCGWVEPLLRRVVFWREVGAIFILALIDYLTFLFVVWLNIHEWIFSPRLPTLKKLTASTKKINKNKG